MSYFWEFDIFIRLEYKQLFYKVKNVQRRGLEMKLHVGLTNIFAAVRLALLPPLPGEAGAAVARDFNATE